MLIKPSSAGLSLLELLIALAIIAIITGLAIPTFIAFYKEYKLEATTETLYETLQYARSEAIKRNVNVYVDFQTGDTWCYGVNPSSICNCAIPSSCSLGTVTATKPQDMSLSGTGLTSNAFYFEGTRGAAGSTIFLTVTEYGLTPAISVEITALGNMQLCSANVSGYQTCG